jgi:glycosyltransferase involved in cell wall biosynthesis
VLVITRDEAGQVAACLASAGFAAERVVVDSGSEDGTREVSAEAGARVLTRAFDTHAEQKNWGLREVSHDWVLVLDADERVTPELRAEIQELLDAPPEHAGYWVRRRNTFLGREIRGAGWDRDRVLRLFDRRQGSYDARRVHEEVSVRGTVGELRCCLEHHSARDLGEWIRKTVRYAELGAAELRGRGRSASWGDLVIRPPARFLKQYVAQGGWRDGVEGLILCTVSAFGVFVKYASLRKDAP